MADRKATISQRIRSKLTLWALKRRVRRTSQAIQRNAGSAQAKRLAPPPAPTGLQRLGNWIDDRALSLAVGSRRGAVRDKPKGHTGTEISGGVIDWDFNINLTWGAWRGNSHTVGEGRRMFTESPDCFRIIMEHTSPLLVGDWTVKPPKAYQDDPEALQIAGFCEDRTVSAPTWHGRLYDALLMPRDGVRLAEFWFHFDEAATAHAWEKPTDAAGNVSRKWRRSDKGRTGLYVPVVQSRLPHTIDRWDQAADGSLAGVWQGYPLGEGEARGSVASGEGRGISYNYLPADEMLVWTYLQEGANFEGFSILRPSWGPQKQWKDLLNLQSIGWRRWAIPTPVAKEAIPDVLIKEDMDDLRESAEQWAVDGNAFLTLIYGAEWDIIQGKIENAGAMDQALDRLAHMMHRAAGTEHVYSPDGLLANSDLKERLNHFLANVEMLADLVAGPYNDKLFPALLEANGWPAEKCPVLSCGSLVAESMEDFSKGIAPLVKEGALTWQLEDEEHLRDKFGLADLTPDTIAAMLGAEAADEPTLDGEPVDIDDDVDLQPDTDVTEPAQDSALNGAQISSAVDIVTKASVGELDKGAAKAMLIEFFNLAPDAADAMLQGEPMGPQPDGGGEPDTDDDESPDPTELSTGPDHSQVLAVGRGRIVTHAEEVEHSAAFGPLAVLAQKHHFAFASRVNRRSIRDSVAAGLRRLLLDIADQHATKVAGKTIQEASKIPIVGKARVVAYLKARYQDVLKAGEEDAAAVIRRQKSDPDYAAEFVLAMEWLEGRDPVAFATVKDKAKDKRDRPTNEYDDLDVDNYIDGAARSTADGVLARVDQSAMNAVQSAQRAGGITAGELQDMLHESLTPRRVEADVQSDVLGVHSTGVRIEQVSEGVEWGWYTTTPELSTQVCEVCADTEGRPDNGFRIGGPLEMTFPTPNPGCLGTVLGGTGDRCWCQVIGLSAPPAGREGNQ